MNSYDLDSMEITDNESSKHQRNEDWLSSYLVRGTTSPDAIADRLVSDRERILSVIKQEREKFVASGLVEVSNSTEEIAAHRVSGVIRRDLGETIALMMQLGVRTFPLLILSPSDVVIPKRPHTGFMSIFEAVGILPSRVSERFAGVKPCTRAISALIAYLDSIDVAPTLVQWRDLSASTKAAWQIARLADPTCERYTQILPRIASEYYRLFSYEQARKCILEAVWRADRYPAFIHEQIDDVWLLLSCFDNLLEVSVSLEESDI